VVSDKVGIGNVGGPGAILPSPSSVSNKPDSSAGPLQGQSGTGWPSFESLLDNTISKQPKSGSPAAVDGLKFSQHALDRMQSRGITFKPEDLLRLNEAVEKAAKKGSKESLMLLGDNALIVSIKNRTVVTAMDREAMKENVFTNIDSTVIL
jgi:flagellar operon protein